MNTSFFPLQSHQALLVSAPMDIAYLTHFLFLVPEEREAFLVITPHKKILIKTSFSAAPINQPDLHTVNNCQPISLANHLASICKTQGITELLIDPTTLFVEEHQMIEKKLSTLGCTVHPFERTLFWQQRMVKSDTEIAFLRTASTIVAKALHETIKRLRRGITEYQLAVMIEERMRALGAERPAFPTIVAFGPHSAEPHHQPSNEPLQTNTTVLFDVGAMFHGYRSDMTRTVWFGRRHDPEFTKIEKIVREAYSATLQRLPQAPAPLAKDLDLTARDLIAAAGYEAQFIHTTGHGVGLDIHEPPSLNDRNETAIAPGMVITIEPGIYLKNTFGYRYENTVLVTTHGGEELTHA